MKRLLSSLLPPSQLVRPVDPDGIDMTLLTDSIRTNGLLVPLTVCNDTIVHGYRRWLVLKGIGETEAECHEVEGDPNVLRVIAQSSDLSRDDKKQIIGDFLTRNRSATTGEISHLYKWSPIEVESIVGVDFLIPEYAAQYASGEMPLSTVWQVARCRDEGQLQLISESPEDLYESAQALHREVRTARRRSMVSRDRGRSHNAIRKELETPCEAGPELLRAKATTPMDGWNAALNWVLKKRTK